MQRIFQCLLILIIATCQPAKGQSLDSLAQLTTYPFPVYYSYTNEERAQSIAQRLNAAFDFYQDLLQFKPTFSLVILSATDWTRYTAEPVVYGMPHYDDKNKRLVLAAEDNAFWRGAVPPLDQLPETLRQPVIFTYTTSAGELSMQAFFDLLAIHELGHAFTRQAGLKLQRNWLSELYCNILLHSYIAEKDSTQLPALTLFPLMVISGDTKALKYTSLKDLQEKYGEIARQYPHNYGWYQCRWHAAAAGIYDLGGTEVAKKLWRLLQQNQQSLTDDQLLELLDKAHTSLGNMVRNWDKK